MKNILIVLSCFILILIAGVSLSFALVEPISSGFTIYGLQFSPNLTMEKVVTFCTSNSCVIGGEGEGTTVTIRSFYNASVALQMTGSLYLIRNGSAYSAGFLRSTEGLDSVRRLSIRYLTPYTLNVSCEESNVPTADGCHRITYLIDSDFNWTEAVKTDLSTLKNFGVIDITDNEINLLSEYHQNTFKEGDAWIPSFNNCDPGEKITGSYNGYYDYSWQQVDNTWVGASRFNASDFSWGCMIYAQSGSEPSESNILFDKIPKQTFMGFTREGKLPVNSPFYENWFYYLIAVVLVVILAIVFFSKNRTTKSL